MSVYQTLYRGFVTEALKAGIVTDAAEFNSLALASVGADVREAARAGDLEAVTALCDAAEAWLDEATTAPSVVEPDENEAWHDTQWQRACDFDLRRSRGAW